MPTYLLGLDDESEASTAFMDLLGNEEEADPLLIPAFGPPLSPFTNPETQLEVFYILNCFRDKLHSDIILLDLNFVPSLMPTNFSPPPGNGYQFQSQIAIQRALQEIENPKFYAAVCPNLLLVPAGKIICDVTIGYANCHIMRRVIKPQTVDK